MATPKKTAIPDEILATYDKIIATVEGAGRKGASMPYTSVNGHMFSFLAADGRMSLRLPGDSREAFIKKHKTALSEQHGVVMKEYVLVPEKLFKDTAKMAGYFKESYDYVSSLKPKPTTKAATGKKPAVDKVVVVGRGNKVDQFIRQKNNPLSPEIQRVREIILGVSDKIEEDIKWEFTYVHV